MTDKEADIGTLKQIASLMDEASGKLEEAYKLLPAESNDRVIDNLRDDIFAFTEGVMVATRNLLRNIINQRTANGGAA